MHSSDMLYLFIYLCCVEIGVWCGMRVCLFSATSTLQHKANTNAHTQPRWPSSCLCYVIGDRSTFRIAIFASRAHHSHTHTFGHMSAHKAISSSIDSPYSDVQAASNSNVRKSDIDDVWWWWARRCNVKSECVWRWVGVSVCCSKSKPTCIEKWLERMTASYIYIEIIYTLYVFMKIVYDMEL